MECSTFIAEHSRQSGRVRQGRARVRCRRTRTLSGRDRLNLKDGRVAADGPEGLTRREVVVSDPAPDELPRSPTGRIPQWVVDEARAGRLPGSPPPPSSARSGPHLGGTGPSDAPPDSPDHPWVARPLTRRERIFRTLQILVATVVVVAMSASIFQRVGTYGWDSYVPDVSYDSGVVFTTGPPVTWPAPARNPSRTPLSAPEHVATASESYAFVQTRSDGVGPVAYDPCRPIHYVVRTEGQPEGGDRLIAEAVARVSRATGLVFVADGTTDEAPSSSRPAVDRDRYGDRWAPVLIGWQTPQERPELEGSVMGLGGSTYVSLGDGPEVFVTGQVVIDAEQAAEHLGRGRRGEDVVRAVLLHELAHLVGLDHVDDRGQLMHPMPSDRLTDFADGDLTGLALLGQGECVPGY